MDGKTRVCSDDKMFHPVLCSIKIESTYDPPIRLSSSRQPTDSLILFNRDARCRNKKLNAINDVEADQHASIGADIVALQKQLLQVDQRLNTLTARLEVLRAVQQALPVTRGESKQYLNLNRFAGI